MSKNAKDDDFHGNISSTETAESKTFFHVVETKETD